MSVSFATLKTRAGAQVAAWVEISGIGDMYTNGVITEANKATLFTDAYTPTLTARNCLEALVDSEARSLDLLTGKGTRGGFSIKLTDFRTSAYTDGYFTRLFGSQRAAIGHARLAEDIDINETDWTLSGTDNTMPGVIAPDWGTAYIGLETVQYRNESAEGAPVLTHWNAVTRSVYRSPSLWHKQNSAGVYKRVTDHPTEWRGRLVRLFVSFVSSGELAGGAAAARASAHQVVGVLERVQFDGEHWVLECSSLDKLLDREACKGLATARVARRIHAEAGSFSSMAFDPASTDAPALHIIQWDITADEQVLFDVYIAPGEYSPSEFVDALNAAIPLATDYDGGAFVGTLTFTWDDGPTLSVNYRTAAAGSERWTQVVLSFATNVGRNTSIADIWEQLVLYPHDVYVVTTDEVQAVTADTNYEITIDAQENAVVFGGGQKTIALQGGPEDSSAGDFLQAGDNYRVVVESQAGRQLAGVESVSAANGTVTVIFSSGQPQLLHEGSPENPIRVTQCVYMSSFDDMVNGPIGSSALRMLMSTGSAAFNHATYDTLPTGVGVEWPNTTLTAGADETETLIDVASFERAFADAAVYCDRVVDIFWKPFKFREWLEKRLAFFGFYLAIENGKLNARQGLLVMQHQQDLSVTKSEMVEAALSFGQDAGIKGVRFKTGRADFGGTEFTRTYLIGSKADLELEVMELSDAGIVTDEERLLRLSDNILVEYSKEAWRYVVDVDRALLDVEPGMVLSVSDAGATDDSSFAGRGLPNPDGTRGLSQIRMLCLSADTDWEDGVRTRLELLASKTKRGGYSASAWVANYANGATAVLTCVQQFFRPTADGVDVGAFAAGDKVRIVLVNPVLAGDAALPDADLGGQSGLTIQSIDTSANTITLTTTIDVDWVSGTDPMVLIHDPYQTASQTDSAKAWCHIGDSSGDIGDLAESVVYEW